MEVVYRIECERLSELAVLLSSWILNTHLCLLLGHLNFHLSEQTRSLEPICSFKQCYMVPDSFHSGTEFLSFFFFVKKSGCFVKKLLCEDCWVRAPTGGFFSSSLLHGSLPAGSCADGERFWARLLEPPPPRPFQSWLLGIVEGGESWWAWAPGPASHADLEGVQQLAVTSPSPDWAAPVCPPLCYLSPLYTINDMWQCCFFIYLVFSNFICFYLLDDIFGSLFLI